MASGSGPLDLVVFGLRAGISHETSCRLPHSFLRGLLCLTGDEQFQSRVNLCVFSLGNSWTKPKKVVVKLLGCIYAGQTLMHAKALKVPLLG